MPDFSTQLNAGGNRGILSPLASGTALGDFFSMGSMSMSNITSTWTANRAVYMPIAVRAPCTAYTISVVVVTQAGNLDVGIYAWDNSRLVSKGSTAVGAAGVQTIDITDTALLPGWYKLAFCCDSSTAIFRGASNSQSLFFCNGRVAAIQEQAVGAVTLPNPATPVAWATQLVPLIVASTQDDLLMDFPSNPLTPPFLHTYSPVYSALRETLGAYGTAAVANSMSWTTANQARYVPMSLPWPYPVNRVFWANGTTITTSNMDFGIYTMDGARIYSTGSTAQVTASALQFVTPSPTFVLPAGDYYFAQNNDNTTNRAHGAVAITAQAQNFGGVLQQAVGAVTLPASATFASASVVGFGLCGVTWTTTTDF